jgi:3-deoxy-manno-octulosonate cytidylyltransferase (CMP-KDO synthetase)
MPLTSDEDAHNPNIVKCVLDQRGYALYFSRGLIPAGKQLAINPNTNYYHHLGLYGFWRKTLLQYTALAVTPLQMAEDLEQLKVLEHGYRMKMAVVVDAPIGVDVPDDILRAEEYLCKQSTSLSPAASFHP